MRWVHVIIFLLTLETFTSTVLAGKKNSSSGSESKESSSKAKQSKSRSEEKDSSENGRSSASRKVRRKSSEEVSSARKTLKGSGSPSEKQVADPKPVLENGNLCRDTFSLCRTYNGRGMCKFGSVAKLCKQSCGLCGTKNDLEQSKAIDPSLRSSTLDKEQNKRQPGSSEEKISDKSSQHRSQTLTKTESYLNEVSSSKEITQKELNSSEDKLSQSRSETQVKKDFPSKEVSRNKKRTPKGSGSSEDFPSKEVSMNKKRTHKGSGSSEDFPPKEVSRNTKRTQKGSGSSEDFPSKEVSRNKKRTQKVSGSSEDFPPKEVSRSRERTPKGSGSSEDFPSKEFSRNKERTPKVSGSSEDKAFDNSLQQHSESVFKTDPSSKDVSKSNERIPQVSRSEKQRGDTKPLENDTSDTPSLWQKMAHYAREKLSSRTKINADRSTESLTSKKNPGKESSEGSMAVKNLFPYDVISGGRELVRQGLKPLVSKLKQTQTEQKRIPDHKNTPSKSELLKSRADEKQSDSLKGDPEAVFAENQGPVNEANTSDMPSKPQNLAEHLSTDEMNAKTINQEPQLLHDKLRQLLHDQVPQLLRDVKAGEAETFVNNLTPDTDSVNLEPLKIAQTQYNPEKEPELVLKPRLLEISFPRTTESTVSEEQNGSVSDPLPAGPPTRNNDSIVTENDEDYFKAEEFHFAEPKPKSLGMKSGVIPDNLITASSSDLEHEPVNSRPGTGRSWRPASNDASGSFLQIDLGEELPVHGLGSLGDPNNAHWTSSYKVSVSSDGLTFRFLQDTRNNSTDKAFNGNIDGTSWVHHCLHRYYGNPPRARHIRFHPVSWQGSPSMRVDAYGYRRHDDPLLVEALKDDVWTTNATGCMCYYDNTKMDCACCESGGCQCPANNRHQCVQCGYGSQCGDPSLKDVTKLIDSWTRTETGCPCHFDVKSSDCACCQNSGCQCGPLNRNQCVRCGRQDQCGRKEDIFGKNSYCVPTTCASRVDEA